MTMMVEQASVLMDCPGVQPETERASQSLMGFDKIEQDLNHQWSLLSQLLFAMSASLGLTEYTLFQMPHIHVCLPSFLASP
ncbi:hypothetical protein OIU84_019997 [Salix udensis]|uniref:Uncharacterized protein n=1 Tax=Salix udensis TaxID=889485 RepID=A0AAD6L099_9ROSI|nr:hypothetical protein OIU84_019997 [Salix udensis]